MSALTHPIRLDFDRLENYATQRRHSSRVRDVAIVNRNEAGAYDSYRAFCRILGSSPLGFEDWQTYSRRIFRESLSSDLRTHEGVTA